MSLMKSLLYTIALLCFTLPIMAQSAADLPVSRKKIYLVSLKDADGYTIQRGILVGTTDSTLLISPNTENAIQLIRASKPVVQAVPIGDVHKLVVKRKGKVARSAMIGAGFGAIPALIIATTTSPDPHFGNGAFRSVFMIMFLAGGAEWGALAGLLPNAKISIQGSPDLYKSMRPLINGYAMSPPSTLRSGASTPLSLN